MKDWSECSVCYACLVALLFLPSLVSRKEKAVKRLFRQRISRTWEWDGVQRTTCPHDLHHVIFSPVYSLHSLLSRLLLLFYHSLIFQGPEVLCSGSRVCSSRQKVNLVLRQANDAASDSDRQQGKWKERMVSSRRKQMNARETRKSLSFAASLFPGENRVEQRIGEKTVREINGRK